MKKFLLLYHGPQTPPDTSHEGWREWFKKINGALVDVGSPMINGFTMRREGSSDSQVNLNGYSIIQAEDAHAIRDLLKDHPYLTLGNEYTIEIFELPRK
jgi:hypothetical protein